MAKWNRRPPGKLKIASQQNRLFSRVTGAVIGLGRRFHPPASPVVCLIPSKAKCRPQGIEPSRQGCLILLAGDIASGIMSPIPLRQLGELSLEDGKKSMSRCGTEPERRPDYIAGTRFLRRLHQPSQAGPVVGNSWNDGRYNESGMNSTVNKPAECPEPGRRYWGAELQPASKPGISRGKRDVDTHLVVL